MAMTVSAQSPESFTLRTGNQKTAKKSKLKVKFVSVIDDSRCPVGVNCIWAGNAKIKVHIIGQRSSSDFEFNTTMGPKGDGFEGWSIVVDSLTPAPKSGTTIDAMKYNAKFTITRLQR